MGAYLSEPVTEKVSTDAAGEAGRGGSAARAAGASAMQGWRVNQEDAHNTILKYDENTSLFAVYDGHGGAEVAAYCAKNLPDYIKQTEAYRSGDLCKALEDAFLGFDAQITTQEVLEVLKKLAVSMNTATSDPRETDSEVETDDIKRLCSEAQQPLSDVLAQYEQGANGPLSAKSRLLNEGTPLSPCLRSKRNKGDELSEAGEGCSGSGACSSSSGEDKGSALAGETSVTSSTSASLKQDTPDTPHTNTEEKDVTTSEAKAPPAADLLPDSSGDTRQAGSGAATSNGDVSEGKSVTDESVTSSRNGEIQAKGKNLASASALMKATMRRAAASFLQHSLVPHGVEDEESDSDDDETFECNNKHNGTDDSSEDGDVLEDGSEEEEEDDEEEEEEEEEDDDEDGVSEEPGQDSGCTAVVALLRGNELYVGNAGDSRCVVCRAGQALDMSVDHKPEDAPELERIIKAGGKVSSDGRINGGLNLSRAIGDHSYKQNKELDAKQQMITALPDVKVLTIDPARDEFMVLACDGIWNFMSSQDVCDFISPRLKEGREKLSQICEEMFDHCLAPSSLGDGTGCDNMTAIIVTFKNDSGQTEVTSVSAAHKRPAEPHTAPDTHDTKRHKPDTQTDVTSTV